METQYDNLKPYRFNRLYINESIFLMSPPDEKDDKTHVELELIEVIGKKNKKEDYEFIKKYDEDILKEYYHILDSFSLNYNKTEIEELLEDIRIVVNNEKIKHNRPRPCVLGKRYQYDINEEFYELSSTSHSPSYPSGHATESMFFSLLFADRFPLYKSVFMEVANNVSNSRLLASFHYPTDNLAGQTLAHVLYNNHYKGKYENGDEK